MLKYLSPASWSLIFLMLMISLYMQAQKISKSQARPVNSVIKAGLFHR